MPTVSGTVTDRSGNVATWSTSWTVASQTPAQPLIVGMNSTDAWDTRLAEVGPAGITARRWYATSTSNKRTSIQQTVADGMIPVVSYKLGVLTASHTSYIQAEANFLAGLGVPVYAAINHEPYNDMTGAQFLASQRALAPIFAAKPNVKVGPILHGWLMDSTANRTVNFADWIAQDLLDNGTYDFMGIDSYQTGSDASPGTVDPGDRIGTLKPILAAKGYPNLPILVGEYNAWRVGSLQSTQVFLDDPQVFMACLWNNTGGVGKILDGDRLTWFRDTFKADPRVKL